MANRAVVIYADVTDISGTTITASVDFTLRYNAASDPGADFNVHKIVHPRAAAQPRLANRHDIDIIVDGREGVWKLLADELFDREPLPIRHQWGLDE